MLTPTKIVGQKIEDAEIVNENSNVTQVKEQTVIPLSKEPENQQSETLVEINKTNPLDNIPPHLRSRVEELKNTINLSDSSSIEKFGSTAQTNSTAASDSLISQIKVGNSSDVGLKINNLLKTTKSLEPSKILNKEPGMIAKMFNMIKDPIEEFRNNQKTVEEAIDIIAKNLAKDAETLLERNKQLQQKYEDNKKLVEEFNIIVAAGVIKINEIEEQELPKLKQIAETSQKDEDVNTYTEMRNFQQRLDSRVSRLNAVRALTLRRIPQIKLLQNAAAKEAETIRDTISTAISAWKEELEIHVANLEIARIAENERNVNAAINESITRTSELLKDTSIQIAQSANGTLIELQTLQTVQNNLIATITEVENINAQGKINRENMAKEIAKMDEDLKQLALK